MGLSFLLERLKASSKDFHPLCVTDFPETENVCPPQENSALTVSYRCFSPVSHNRRFATKDKILCSVSGSAARSAFAISIVGIMAWWSVTFLLFSILFMSGLPVLFSSNIRELNTASITPSAVCPISSDKQNGYIIISNIPILLFNRRGNYSNISLFGDTVLSIYNLISFLHSFCQR